MGMDKARRLKVLLALMLVLLAGSILAMCFAIAFSIVVLQITLGTTSPWTYLVIPSAVLIRQLIVRWLKAKRLYANP
jgi:antibiotic biosynthesis monooxygenase (ABM) superfamily enzyme